MQDSVDNGTPVAGAGREQHRKLLGQLLLAAGGLRPEELAEGIERQRLLAARHRYYMLGRILIGLGYATVDNVKDALAVQGAAPSALVEIDHAGSAPAAAHRLSPEGRAWQVTTQYGPVRPVSVLRSLANMEEKIAAGYLETIQPIPLGFDPLDDALGGGLRAGELLLLAGGQGVGKTTMAFQMARNIAASEEASCLYICYEHDDENMTQRLISMESIDPNSQDLRLGVTVRELTREVVAARRRETVHLFAFLESDPRTSMALRRLRRYGDRLYLVKGSNSRTTLDAISSLIEAHRVRSDKRLVVFVDYLQKVPVLPVPPSDKERVTKVAEGLKELALTQQVPVVAIVAADRDGLKAKRMRAHHLEGSAALAYEADVILVLSDKYDAVARVHIEFNPQRAEGFRDWLVCSVEKNRSGRDVIDLEFEKRFSYCCLNPNGRYVSEKLIDERMYVD